MVNYELGKIYKIVSDDLTYYGSTCEPTLARRMADHRSRYRNWKHGNKRYVSSFKVFENGEPDIVLVESFPCKTRDELHARERFYIENNDCVNKVIPTRTHKEYENYRKTTPHRIQYNEENREKMKIINQIYEEKNKEKIRLRKQQYYLDNKENIIVRNLAYRAKIKEAKLK